MGTGPIIGIDLGTTNSCVAVLEGAAPVVIHNHEGGRTTPSMVSWSPGGDVVVGSASRRQMITNPTRTVQGVKRLIGRRLDAPEIERMRATLPYKLTAAPNGDAWVKIDEHAHSPQEISSHVLRKMKQVAEDYLGREVTEAIVTVPAYFDDVQRRATRDAGAIAGLDVRAILNEPTAAALAYGVHKQTDQKLAVFDLGGGTFDISILVIEAGVFEVRATNGDTHLGGDDFDRRIIELLIKEFHAAQGVDLGDDPIALQRLKEAAERAKVELSSALTTEINLPFLSVQPTGPLHLMRELTRGELEAICRDLIEGVAAPCAKALADARVSPGEIDQVLLVGGMTRMPAVAARVIDIFGRPPSKGVNPDEIVAMGAAVQSGIMSGEISEVVLLDVTPRSLGLRAAGGVMSVVIPANTTVPTREQKAFATTEDNQTHVSIEVYQGESPRVADNRYLGRFVLGDLPARPAGRVRVRVSFTLDADGLLEVTATEGESGRAASVKIEAASGLSADDVERLRGGV